MRAAIRIAPRCIVAPGLHRDARLVDPCDAATRKEPSVKITGVTPWIVTGPGENSGAYVPP